MLQADRRTPNESMMTVARANQHRLQDDLAAGKTDKEVMPEKRSRAMIGELHVTVDVYHVCWTTSSRQRNITRSE
jgi:hypothetical protein